MASAPQTRVEQVEPQRTGLKGDPQLATLKSDPVGKYDSSLGKGHDDFPQREKATHSLLSFGPNKGLEMSKGQSSGGLPQTLQEAPFMKSIQGGSNQEGLKRVGLAQDASVCAGRELEAKQHGDSIESGATGIVAPAAKREPLRSKRYVPPKQIDINNLGEPSPAGSSPSPSQTLKSPGPSQRSLADRSTAVLALPAALPPGSQAESQRQLPTPRQSKKHAVLTIPVPAPQVKKPPKPQAHNHTPNHAPNHTPRFPQPVNPPPSSRPHFPNKPEVAPPPVEKKKDARTLSVKIWMLEQLLKSDSVDAGAVGSLVQCDMSLVNGAPRLKKLYATWRIRELVRCGRVPATAEDFGLLDEILPADQDRTQNLLLNLKTEAVIQHLRVTDDRADRNWKLFSWALRLFFTDGGVSSVALQARRAELLAAEKARRKQVAAKALLARYPLEILLQQLRMVVEEAKSDEPTFLEQVFNDVSTQKYVPSSPAPLLTDLEAVAFAEADARENRQTDLRNGSGFSGREQGLVDVDELERKAGGKKGSKSAPLNGAFATRGILGGAAVHAPASRRNLAFKPGKHKPPSGPVEIVVPRPVGTPIRERWWEKQIRGPSGKFFAPAAKNARIENGFGGGAESGGEGRGKAKGGGGRMSGLGPGAERTRLERNGTEPNEARMKEQEWVKEAGKEWVGGPEEPGPKKKRILDVVIEGGGGEGGFALGGRADGAVVEGGSAEPESAGAAEERPRKTSRERKSKARWPDYEWWDGSGGASEGSAEGGESEEEENWAVLGEVDENDGHEGLCKVCGQPGTLLLCEGCPKVYHYKCAGLDEMPLEDKWWCPACEASQPLGGSADGYAGLGGLEWGSAEDGLAGGGDARPRPSGEEAAAAMLVMLGDGNGG
ncbi:hypothetical protein KFL_005440060 [Klebsormidium nitens]|uniref:PHD-type domain-containing protein n=1 Tax=Klebsormidium nitens TaxID=105231 RepID=A0A1Y1IND1_KLENI|nr:hypothetical protein KFL_005440060 [Klebsormidium nitens]|eukprot:GAQ89628.1 hypothetical protein KFL_005440060 [Klebsormidium nitens]